MRADATLRLLCNDCVGKEKCPRYDPNARCYFEEQNVVPDLKTADGILETIREKIELDYVRYQRASRAQTFTGDPQVSNRLNTLSHNITKDLVFLAELSEKFGKMDGKTQERPQVTHIHADKVDILQITGEELEKCKKLQQELDLLKQQRERLQIPEVLP